MVYAPDSYELIRILFHSLAPVYLHLYVLFVGPYVLQPQSCITFKYWSFTMHTGILKSLSIQSSFTIVTTYSAMLLPFPNVIFEK